MIKEISNENMKRIFKKELFWSVLQTIIAVIGFCVLCIETRLNRINNQRSMDELKIHYTMNYIHDTIDDLYKMVITKDYCEDNPENVSERYMTIIANFKTICNLLFQDKVLLRHLYYKDKKFRDFIEYFILISFFEKNFFNERFKKYECHFLQTEERKTALFIYFSQNELQDITNKIEKLRKEIIIETH